MSNFVQEVIGRLKGDESEVIAAQNERKAKSAFKQQLSSLESQLVDDEVLIEEKLEAYNNALYPTKRIKDNKDYLLNIKIAKQDLDIAEGELENTQDSIKFFTSEMDKAFKVTKK